MCSQGVFHCGDLCNLMSIFKTCTYGDFTYTPILVITLIKDLVQRGTLQLPEVIVDSFSRFDFMISMIGQFVYLQLQIIFVLAGPDHW